jgi:hypothetical protein
VSESDTRHPRTRKTLRVARSYISTDGVRPQDFKLPNSNTSKKMTGIFSASRSKLAHYMV